MKIVDLRSDTVTKPTPDMREAMANAAVGDDVYGEDPNVNRLQELAAEMMGKQAGLFVASGTMGNLVAVLTHCQRGDEVIVGKKNHIFVHEAGGLSALGGIHSNQLTNQQDGSLAIEDVQEAIRPDDVHEPITRLICLENTHNGCGGVFQTPEYTKSIADYAHERDLSVHLDGARIFNAAAAQEIPAKELAESVDSVTFCLSKGLCAPVGSVLCGSTDFIERAKRLRKMVGGGMRQAGILAAAGIVALNRMVPRLGEDHDRARNLADGIRKIPGIKLKADHPATNMVFFQLLPEVKCSTEEFITEVKKHGILIDYTGEREYRLVTHYWIDDFSVEQAVNAFEMTVETLIQG